MKKVFFPSVNTFCKNVSHLILLFICMLGTVSCGSDDEDGGITTNRLLGEWAEMKTESYDSQNNLVRTSSGWKSDQAAWVFGENGYFYYGVYGTKGSYTLSGNKIKITGTETEGSFEIRELTDSTLVVWHKYPDEEYSYQITYFERLSINEEGTIDEDAMKFVGTWFDGNKYYWYFAKNGDVYVSEKKNINSKNYITKKSWAYDASTNTIATTVSCKELGNRIDSFTYSWTVLVFSNDFWTGKKLYGKEGAVTFTKVE